LFTRNFLQPESRHYANSLASRMPPFPASLELAQDPPSQGISEEIIWRWFYSSFCNLLSNWQLVVSNAL
jgi:hypothetical protein